MDLNKVLESFARGEINKEKAREIIHTLFKESRNAPQPDPSGKIGNGEDKPQEGAEGTDGSAEPFKRAFEKIKRSRNFDEFFKASSGIVQQIAGNIPTQIEKLQETYLQDTSFAGLPANIKGITSKFSLFRSFAVGPDCSVSENQAVGCQWFAVSFADGAQVSHNKFTAVQISEMGVERSNVSGNHVALSRLSNVTLRKARMDSNRLSRSTLSDASLAESDFVENRLSKAEFAQTAIHSSRLARNVFSGATFQECDFDSCDIQGIEFENCSFQECSFLRVEVRAETPVKIADRSLVGRTIQDCTTIEALLAALGAPATSETNEGGAKKTQSGQTARAEKATPTPKVAKSRPEPEAGSHATRRPSDSRRDGNKETQATHRKSTEERSTSRSSRPPRSK